MKNRSFLSKIEEYILRKTKPEYMTSQEKVEQFLDNNTDKPFSTIFHTTEFHNMKMVNFGEKYSDSHVILYIHGGAYVNQMNYQHTVYCYLLEKLLKTRIVAPVYPLTPEHDCEECYKLITQLYLDYVEKYKHVTLMGDSAGGGFVLGFCQYLKTLHVKLPDNIIVFSPWVDISMKKEYDDTNDPILGNIGLREIGKRWAGKLDTNDYHVSPYYGDNSNLPRTLIFVGSNEIFYNDVKEYYEKLVNDGVDAELIVGEGLFHIYPLFPIPEAISSIKKIKKEFDNL